MNNRNLKTSLYLLQQKKKGQFASKNWLDHFDELVSYIQEMNNINPPVYNTVSNVIKDYQCPPRLATDNILGAFRPPTIPDGLWSRKRAIFRLKKGNFILIQSNIT